MDNRNQPRAPRSRQDSITNAQRRGMQQGYPVREDATLTFDRPVNRPTGPREVPQSMRQGKIPVRQNASTGRTYPVMNRNGQQPGSVPEELQPQPTVKKKKKAYDFDAEDMELTAAQEPAKAAEALTNTPEQADNSVSDLPAQKPQTFPEEKTEELHDDAAEALKQPCEPAQEPMEDTTEAICISEQDAHPAPAESDEVPQTPQAEEPDESEEPQEIAADTPVQPSDAVQDPSDAAAEFSGISEQDAPPVIPLPVQHEDPEPAAAPSEQATDSEPAAVQTEQTADSESAAVQTEQAADPTPSHSEQAPQQSDAPVNGKKIWILPLAIAILIALGMCIGIPAAMSSSPTEPDFDMTLRYDDAIPDEGSRGELDETSGAGREEAAETDTTAPETTPPPAKFNVTLTFYERDPILISTSEITLGALLEKVNYTVLDSDRFPMDFSDTLTEEIVIAVDTVKYGTASETLTIPFETKTTNVQTIPRGQKNVTQYGQNGTKVITYTTEIVNGVEVSRTVASEKITKEPVTETYQLGVGGTLVGNDGNTYSYSYYRMVNATFYDIEGLTYLGYEADESVVAVDMDYIPLGTKIYVKNDQFDFGVRIAADTGSMIEGWEVDIWLDDSNPQKNDFAYIGYVRNMIIYYLD